MHWISRSLLLGLCVVAVAACNRDQAPVVKTTDSVSTTVTTQNAVLPDTSRPAAGTAAQAPATAPATGPATAQPAASPDSIETHVLSPDDPIAKKMLEAMRGKAPGTTRSAGPVHALNVIPSSQLGELQPKIPGYSFVAQPSNFDGQGQSRSTALLRSSADPTKTIRVIIKSEDETMGSSFEQKVNELRQAGSLTDYSQGEPITAYYLQVGGMPAAKAYIPSKHVATLTVFVGDHRLIQLREDKVNSADHLVEVSKYLDVRRFAAMKP
jgi:hypothetical protein